MVLGRALLKRSLSIICVLIILVTHIIGFEKPALASPTSFTSQLSEVGRALLEDAKQLSLETVEKTHDLTGRALDKTSKLSNLASQEVKTLSPVIAKNLENSLQSLIAVLSNQKIIESARHFSTMTPDNFCRAYFDSVQGVNNAKWAAVEEGAETAFTVIGAMTSASAAGAGSLAGYAGMASVVSQMGLGSLMTTVAGLMGSNVAGAAATSVVTAAVGGPVVMGALLAGGAGIAAYGTYELGKFSMDKFNTWAGIYCGSGSQPL